MIYVNEHITHENYEKHEFDVVLIEVFAELLMNKLMLELLCKGVYHLLLRL